MYNDSEDYETYGDSLGQCFSEPVFIKLQEMTDPLSLRVGALWRYGNTFLMKLILRNKTDNYMRLF